MASNDSDAVSATSGPVLAFRPHDGSYYCIQMRQMKGSAHPEPGRVECLPSFFPLRNRFEHEGTVVYSFVLGFQIIEKNMCAFLAQALVEVLVKTWDQDTLLGSWGSKTPALHPFYAKLRGHDGSEKSLHYPYWFYLAAWWGPGHPALESIRRDMSELWGVEFPEDAIVYPADVGVKSQKRLFAGIPHDHKSQARQDRVQELKRTIENTPVEGLADVISAQLPVILNKPRRDSSANGFESVKEELESIGTNLAIARDKVDGLQNNMANFQADVNDLRARQETHDSALDALGKDKDATDRNLDNLKTELDTLKAENRASNEKSEHMETRVKDLEDKLVKANKRAEKAVETCALVLSLLETPGADKRKRGCQA
ncbi:hypothetical protein F66182_8124 [Fusarium sp. NRRL 66182]|nr:hypothetical protein F66182_8124 [Fusarium sp. NRRL 66182]